MRRLKKTEIKLLAVFLVATLFLSSTAFAYQMSHVVVERDKVATAANDMHQEPQPTAKKSPHSDKKKEAVQASAANSNAPQPVVLSANDSVNTAQNIESQTVLNEQFLGNTLNTDQWEIMQYPKAYRNNEEQDYTASQVAVSDGMLRITANRDQKGDWHSGEVHSKWQYKYGEFEVRMALSTSGAGVWPAAWLMGKDNAWPNNGEIDIFENVNGEKTIHGTIHGGGTKGHWQLQKSLHGIDVTQFHTYKIVKSPGHVSWWVDGTMQGEWLQSQTPAGGVWPFEKYTNYALLNLAIGGTWPGPSNASTPNTVTMLVDHFIVTNGE